MERQPVTADLITRVDLVERASFMSLYTAGEPWGTGWRQHDGVTAVWAGQDADPSFSCVLDLARSPHPDQTLATLEHIVRDSGALVFGVDTHPDLASWATPEHLEKLGFVPDCEECIWARPIDRAITARPLPEHVELVNVQQAEREIFARVLNEGWNLSLDAARGQVFAATIGAENWRHYLAYVNGVPAGVSVLFVHDNVADCFLSTTLPHARGQGVQTALIERRLADGLALGCDLATSQTVVNNSSPRNMARQGFTPLYRRWIYGKKLR